MFSTSAKPAPIAKPMIAASTRKPICAAPQRVEQTERLERLLGDRRDVASRKRRDARPVTLNSHAWSGSVSERRDGAHHQRPHEHRRRHELEAVEEHQQQQERRDRQQRPGGPEAYSDCGDSSATPGSAHGTATAYFSTARAKSCASRRDGTPARGPHARPPTDSVMSSADSTVKRKSTWPPNDAALRRSGALSMLVTRPLAKSAGRSQLRYAPGRARAAEAHRRQVPLEHRPREVAAADLVELRAREARSTRGSASSSP